MASLFDVRNRGRARVDNYQMSGADAAADTTGAGVARGLVNPNGGPMIPDGGMAMGSMGFDMPMGGGFDGHDNPLAKASAKNHLRDSGFDPYSRGRSGGIPDGDMSMYADSGPAFAMTAGEENPTFGGHSGAMFDTPTFGGHSNPATSFGGRMTPEMAMNPNYFINSYDVGTPYVPEDQIAMVHQGEAIIPAQQNPFSGPRPRGGGAPSPFFDDPARMARDSEWARQTLAGRGMTLSGRGGRGGASFDNGTFGGNVNPFMMPQQQPNAMDQYTNGPAPLMAPSTTRYRGLPNRNMPQQPQQQPNADGAEQFDSNAFYTAMAGLSDQGYDTSAMWGDAGLSGRGQTFYNMMQAGGDPGMAAKAMGLGMREEKTGKGDGADRKAFLDYLGNSENADANRNYFQEALTGAGYDISPLTATDKEGVVSRTPKFDYLYGQYMRGMLGGQSEDEVLTGLKGLTKKEEQQGEQKQDASLMDVYKGAFDGLMHPKGMTRLLPPLAKNAAGAIKGAYDTMKGTGNVDVSPGEKLAKANEAAYQDEVLARAPETDARWADLKARRADAVAQSKVTPGPRGKISGGDLVKNRLINNPDDGASKGPTEGMLLAGLSPTSKANPTIPMRKERRIPAQQLNYGDHGNKYTEARIWLMGHQNDPRAQGIRDELARVGLRQSPFASESEGDGEQPYAPAPYLPNDLTFRKMMYTGQGL